MKTNRTKKLLVTLGVPLLMLLSFSTEAFSWGAATHAYIEDHLGRKRGLFNDSEIYGGMLPDVFNYLFDYPTYLGYLYNETHNEFLKVWNASRAGLEKSLAYGFAGHNDSGPRREFPPSLRDSASDSERRDYQDGHWIHDISHLDL